MTKLIILRGYPGSGKTTIGKSLAQDGIGTFIDHNAILTFVAGIAGNDDGIYNDIANLELAITKKLLSERKDVIVARGFSGIDSMRAYESVAAKLDAESIIIRLTVDRNTLSKRVSSSERLQDFNPTVTMEALEEWINANPLIDHPSENTIDNTGNIDDVIESIKAVI